MIASESIPLGVSDAQGRFGAVGRNHRDVDLIDLISGEVLRRMRGVGTPLMIDGPELLGWQNQSGVTHLFSSPISSPDNAIGLSNPFELPDWVDPLAGSGADFAIKFGRDRASYVLSWKARPHRVGGVPPSFEAAAASQSAHGRFVFDVRTLEIQGHDGLYGFADEDARERRGEDLARHAGGFVYRQASQLRNAVWDTPDGERYLRSWGSPGERRQSLSILRADAPESPPVVTMDAVELDRAAPELSLDGCHLAVIEDEASPPRWGLYRTGDGRKVASFAPRGDFRSFRVFDRRLIFLEEVVSGLAELTIETGNILHALNIESAEPLWSYALEPVIRPNTMFLPGMIQS